MKKTIIFASVAIATLFAFSSCQKENLQDNGSTNGVRIITAEFENNATKTTLNSDGVTPEWKEGDIIRILGTAPNEYADITLTTDNIKNDGRTITFGTSFTGTLYAVYPASATTMESCGDGNITFTIPAIQDGTFASANICVAKSIADDETNKDNLVFRNATSVLEFSQTASNGVLRVCATAANAIAGTLTATFGEDNKATVSASGLTGKTIWTTAAATAQNKYYVAVAPVETGDITFNYYKAEEEKSESKDSKTLALNKIYALTIPTEDYTNSYVSIGGKKWAKYNLGATTVAGSASTCYGDYFAWGETAPYYEGTGGWPATPTWKSGMTGGYAWLSYCGSSDFSEWSTPPYNATTKILEPEFDAASQILGNGWRMPTTEEFEALSDACDGTDTPAAGGSTSTTEKGVYWCDSYDGVAGLLFIAESNGPHLFFPAAGLGGGTALDEAGDCGYYWSSSLNTGLTDAAYTLSFDSVEVNPQNNYFRYCGISVRPVSD